MPRCWTAALLLLLAAGTRPHSGGGPGDEEPTISCTSHILTSGSSLTCWLAGGPVEDDEDEGGDGVGNMTACFFDYSLNKAKCLEAFGDTFSSGDLHPILQLNVTVHLKRGGRITTTVDLQKIIQPRSPQVKDVTFDEDSHQVVIRLQTPYVNEYLKVDNQLFQLHIWSAGSSTTQNVSSDSLRMDVQNLRPHAKYHVRARAVPTNGLQGSWSRWSGTFSFFSPAEEKSQNQTSGGPETNGLIVCLVILVAVPSSVALFCRNKIFTYMWPSIPHPKDTLVHICKMNKGLLLNFKPEEFSALDVEKAEKQSWEEAEPPMKPSCSTQTSDGCMSTTSVSTEELELSTLLSRSSLDGEESLQSASPSPFQDLRPGERPPSCSGGVKEAEAYVTMSSFYQIK